MIQALINKKKKKGYSVSKYEYYYTFKGTLTV